MAEQTTTKEPTTGEVTGRQARGDVASTLYEIQGLSEVPAGTYETYKKIIKDPTVALARMVVMAPIVAGAWSFEAKDKQVKDEWVEFIREQIEPMRTTFVRDALRALDYGWAGWEKVFELQDGKLVLKKLKSLLVDLTKINVDRDTGRFEGFKQEKVNVALEKSLLFTYDREGDNHYGTARTENVRAPWSWWNDANEGAARYDRKIAGVMPIVHYPPGESTDKHGVLTENYVIAQKLLNSIASGKGICVPNEFAGHADDRDLSSGEKRRWIIELLEDKGSRQGGFGERLKYLDSLKVRAYLRPERAALEANSGGIGTTDSEVMQDIGMLDGELLHADIVKTLNWHVIDQLLVLNFGEEARGAVFVTPAPLVDSKRQLVRELIKAFATTPDGREDLKLWLDIDSVLDLLELPKSDDTIEVKEQQEDEEDPSDQPAPPSNVPTSGSGSDQIREIMKKAMAEQSGGKP